MTKQEPSGHGVTYVYRVEARIKPCPGMALQPVVVGKQVFTETWRKVSFVPSQIGVPNKLYNGLAEQQGYLTFEAAMALSAWVQADARHWSGLQTRLVQTKFEYSFTTTEQGVCDPLDIAELERSTKFYEREPGGQVDES